VYARSDHPTVEELSRKIALLEGAEAVRVFPSGMAAVASLLVTLLKPGDHVVLQRDLFPRTRTFLRDHLERAGSCTSRSHRIPGSRSWTFKRPRRSTLAIDEASPCE
jgi:cystathionine beta-lyase/cystathionine gamma-synthase